MTLTSTYLLNYAKSLDARLASMTDADLMEKIRYAFHKVSGQIQCFYKTEEIDIKHYIDNGIYSFEFIPTESIIDYYSVDIVNANDLSNINSYIILEKTNDNTYIINVDRTKDIQNSVNAIFSYMYYFEPSIGMSIEVNPEVFEFLKFAIQIECWDFLKDMQKVTYYQAQFDRLFSRKSIAAPHNIYESALKGGYV